MNPQIADLEKQLNSFSLDVRLERWRAWRVGSTGRVPLEAETDVANMHCHTFFSFNATTIHRSLPGCQRRGFKPWHCGFEC